MEKYIKEFQDFIKFSLRTIDDLTYYLNASKHYKEVDLLVETIEEIMVNDTLDNRFELFLRIYETLSLVLTEPPDAYLKYKFRYFIMNWQVDSSEAIFNLNLIIKEINVYNDQLISAVAFYKLVFVSKDEALQFLRQPFQCTEVFLKRIISMVTENDYYSLINRMGEYWYFPVIKQNDKCMELIQKIQSRTLNVKKVEFIINCTVSSDITDNITNTSNKNLNYSPVPESPVLNTISRTSNNNRRAHPLVKIEDSKDHTTIEGTQNQNIEINDPLCSSLDDSFMFLTIKNTNSDSTRKQTLDDNFDSSETTIQAKPHTSDTEDQLNDDILNQNIDPEYSYQTPLQSHKKNMLKTPKKTAMNNISSYIISPIVKFQGNIDSSYVDDNVDIEASIILNYDVDSQIDNIINLTERTSKILFGSYECQKLIGEGGMSKVYSAIGKHDRQTYAVKVIVFENNLVMKDVETEIKIMTIMSSTNYAIRLIDSLIGDKGAVIVMEKAKCDMKTFIQEKQPDISPDFILKYWTAMLRCVKALHDKRISHLDLKLQNFVMTESERIKLIDFGISRQLSLDTSLISDGESSGTFIFMSPELLSGKSEFEPKKCDVWAMGIVLYTLIYNFQPRFKSGNKVYASTSCQNFSQLLTNKRYSIFKPDSKKLTPLLRQIMDMCLVYEFKQRPSVEELLKLISLQ